MGNLAEAKFEMRSILSEGLDVIKTTSEIFKPTYVTEYEKKRQADKKAIHAEIARVANRMDIDRRLK